MEKTKKQLEEELASVESALLKLQGEVKQVLKDRDVRIQEVLDKGKELDQLKVDFNTEKKGLEKQIESKEMQLQQLTAKFNELAKLFDEYIKGFDDIMEVQKLFLRNNIRSQELLQIKIRAFNGEGDNKE